MTKHTPEPPPPVTILAVDDNPENIILLEVVLSELGYRVIGAANGVQALEILPAEHVDLIISDAMMPKMDGFQLCKSVKNNPALKSIPFIIYTADYLDDEDKDLAATIGADRYVVKSGGTDSVVLAVSELLNIDGPKIGYDPDQQKLPLDDQSFLEQHYKLLVKKLEEKMQNLEIYSQQLLIKNEQLQRSERRYRLLFEKASIAIFVLDPYNGRVTDANQFALHLLGYDREELLALGGLPVMQQESDGPSLVEAGFSGELTMRTKDGRVLCMESDVALIDHEDHSHLIVFSRDTTERKTMVERLFQSEKLSMLGTIAAGIAHEVRNPLAGIKLNLQFLEQKYGPAFEEYDVLTLAIQGTQHIEKVVENTLTMARSTAPDVHISDIRDLVAQSAALLRLMMNKKSIDFTAEIPADLPQVKIDAQQMLQVLLNIIRNAVEATPPKGSIAVTVSVEPAREDSLKPRLCCTVTDSGPGIADEYLKNAFELFRTTKSTGTGLGLSLSRRIMQQHGGDIAITRPAQGGTSIILYLPIP
ncbi:MAG: response regulator [Bacteroidetes bacterium]|nr:response regulator [Bacteroidota bacterium]